MQSPYRRSCPAASPFPSIVRTRVIIRNRNNQLVVEKQVRGKRGEWSVAIAISSLDVCLIRLGPMICRPPTAPYQLKGIRRWIGSHLGELSFSTGISPINSEMQLAVRLFKSLTDRGVACSFNSKPGPGGGVPPDEPPASSCEKLTPPAPCRPPPWCTKRTRALRTITP